VRLGKPLDTYFLTPNKTSFMTIQTEAVHFRADQRLIDLIESKLSKLDHFFDRIISADVILKLQNTSSKFHGKILEIKIQVPGGELFIKETHRTFEAALDQALVTLKRNLVKYKERHR
jgi:putative sigma-54 modulation protein